MMTTRPIISWHEKAILIDQQGTPVSVAQAAGVPAAANCDPTIPAQSLPAYINALETGLGPVMGSYQGDRSTTKGDFVTQTGGSTGKPKTIVRNSDSWVKSFNHMGPIFQIDQHARVAVLGHLNHSLALYAALEAVHLGAEIHTLGGLNTNSMSAELIKRNISHIYATPTQLRLIRSRKIPQIKHLIVGGGKLSNHTKTHIKTVFTNAAITEFYGTAETSFITISDKLTPKHSVGHAFKNVQIRIKDTQGNDVKFGTMGQVWVNSPYVFKGYLPTARVAASHRDDWIYTGEIGHLDQDGYLFLTGRADRAVTIADQTVYLDQLEAKISKILNIEPIAIIAIADPLRGYRLHAVISENLPITTDWPSILIDLPPFVRPKTVSVIKDWPLLASGKTDYKKLETLIKPNNHEL